MRPWAGLINNDFMQDEQIRQLNDRPARNGSYVLYWMQQSQRANANLALEYAIERANEAACPVLVGFVLDERYPEANARHFAFMLQGLVDVAEELAERAIGFVVARGTPPDPIMDLAAEASVVVCDRGYVRHVRAWRSELARQCEVEVVEVEDNAVVPVDLVSTKREYAARTIRPKIHRHLDRFLGAKSSGQVIRRWVGTPGVSSHTGFDSEAMLARIAVDRAAAPVSAFVGGRREALRRLDQFVRLRLNGYAEKRSDPSLDATSTLSPYLHFGHLAPVEIVRAVQDADTCGQDDRDTLVEELVVRRELAINYAEREPDYDEYGALPEWARKTLDEHRSDPRPYVYDIDQLESAQTHDPYWNAAMTEMTRTGFMHNYMRMYWGKKILEWMSDPEEAFYTALYLNNKYFLDGRDPNSYAGVGWVFGLHDRPWTRRPIFGTIRYMNANGLKRKFDIERYVRRVEGGV
ncbi:MAG: deoxyribodipyrimidine photo-lyase [Rhodothermales bacterium]